MKIEDKKESSKKVSNQEEICEREKKELAIEGEIKEFLGFLFDFEGFFHRFGDFLIRFFIIKVNTFEHLATNKLFV